MRARIVVLGLGLALGLGHAEEQAPGGKLKGRVFERGSTAPLAGVTVTPAQGEPVVTDAEGRFELALPAGPNEILLQEETHEPLRVTEQIRAGEGVTVEYRLLPLADWKRRYQTTVRGEARHEGERFTLKGDELRQVPGALGDPFRAVSLLPGVATPVPLLPLYVVRGASPGMNGFFLDGMRVPQLFHFLVGGGVVHARLVDRLDFYPGTYDASFGRYAGGIIDAETRPARRDAPHGEVELRLYDVSAVAEARLPGDLLVTASGHFGYPGPIIRLVEPDVDIQYWDYQLRLDWKGLTLEAIGSYDNVVLPNDLFASQSSLSLTADQLELTFHRVQLRERARLGVAELEAAVVGGYDQMIVFGFGVRKLALNARANIKARLPRVTIYAGVDGELSRFIGENFQPDTMGQQAPDELGDLAGNRDGIVGSAFAEATVEVLHKRLFVTGGARVDAYHAGNVTLVGIDPRFNYRVVLLPQLQLKGGIGYYQQPPSLPVSLPGIDTYALQLGLQHALQASSGVEATLPGAVTVSLTGFYERFNNINDVVLDFAAQLCTAPPPESLSGVPARVTRQLDGQSFGAEVLVRKHTGRFTGWIAYTLSRSERIYSCGLRPADFDQTHVLNVVAQVRLPWNLMVGGRLYLATGRPFTHVFLAEDGFPSSPIRNNDRIDTYYQLDLRVDREWIFNKWALSVFIEALNLTYSKTIFRVSYPQDQSGVTRYDQPNLDGIRWVLPSIGVRGRF